MLSFDRAAKKNPRLLQLSNKQMFSFYRVDEAANDTDISRVALGQQKVHRELAIRKGRHQPRVLFLLKMDLTSEADLSKDKHKKLGVSVLSQDNISHAAE